MTDRARYVANSAEQPMKAVVFEEWEGPLKLVNNIAAPSGLAENEVIISVKSFSINPIDWKIRRGDLKLIEPNHFPKIPGRDLSGTVYKVGPNVTRFQVGDEVFAMAEQHVGTYAEYVKCSEDAVAKKPKNLNWNEAAAVPLVSLTAHECLLQIAKVTAGQTVLILGGGSSVGLFGIQYCKIQGATVYATCGTNKIELVKSMGADYPIDYKNQDFAKVLGDKKVDIVFDSVGNPSERDKSFTVVKAGGMVVTTTPNDHEKPVTVTEALKTGADIIEKKVANYLSNGVSYKTMFVSDHQANVLEQISKWIEQGSLKVTVDSVYPLERVQEASDKSQNGKLTGKVVVEVSK